jgi:hypothetical protein
MIHRRRTRMVLPKGALTMALALSRAHGESLTWEADAVVVTEADEQDDSHGEIIRSHGTTSLRGFMDKKTRFLESTTRNDTPILRPTLPPVDDSKIIDTTMQSSVTYAGSMFDIKAKDNIVITSIGFHTAVESDYMKVQLYTREGTYKGCETDISKWTLQADVTIQGRGIDKLTFLPEGSFDPILVKRMEMLGIYITTDQASFRAEKGTAEGKKFKSNSDIIIYEGVGKRYPIERATFGPRIWNGAIQYGVVDIPTLSPVTPTMEPTAHPIIKPKVDAFRLRLYWEKGYFWQETHVEFWWCMECRDGCVEGDMVYIDECDSSVGQLFTYVGDTIRPAYDTSLCLTALGYTRDTPMRFLPCTGDSDQSFVGMTKGEKFELHQQGDSDHCVSQNHHPKSFERVYPEQCDLTRIHDTSYWITY